MYLAECINQQLDQVQEVLGYISDEQYVMPVKILSDATVGQHVRHIIDFFVELNKGYQPRSIHYERRKRDVQIESERLLAIRKLQEIRESLIKPDKMLLLLVDYGNDENLQANIATSYYRELAYNLEHTIHHMALIRVGITAISDISLPETFGVALSTLKFRKAPVQ